MRGHTCYGSEVFGDTYQRSIVFAHAISLYQHIKIYLYETIINFTIIFFCS